MYNEAEVMWYPLFSIELIEYLLVKIQLPLFVRETLCDVYIICQESHDVGVLHSK